MDGGAATSMAMAQEGTAMAAPEPGKAPPPPPPPANRPEPAQAAPPSDGQGGVPKLFVGALPKDATSELLTSFFSQFGGVERAEVITDPTTGTARGFGFVTFSDMNAFQRVLDNYERNEIAGKWVDCKPAAPMGVKGCGKGGKGGPKGKVDEGCWGPAKGKGKVGTEDSDFDATNPPEKLFVGKLPRTTSEMQMREYFSTFGEVAEVHMKMADDGLCKGYAFVVFKDAKSAQLVLDNYDTNQLNGTWVDCKRPMKLLKTSGKGGKDGWNCGKAGNWDMSWGGGCWGGDSGCWGKGGGWGGPCGGGGGGCWEGNWGGNGWQKACGSGKGGGNKGGKQGCNNCNKGGWDQMGGCGQGCQGNIGGNGMSPMAAQASMPMQQMQATAGAAILVRGLPAGVSGQDLQEHFSRFGPIAGVDLRPEEVPGMGSSAHVWFASPQAAQAVVGNYDNNIVGGSWVDCQLVGSGEAQGQATGMGGCSAQPAPPPMQGAAGCYGAWDGRQGGAMGGQCMGGGSLGGGPMGSGPMGSGPYW